MFHFLRIPCSTSSGIPRCHNPDGAAPLRIQRILVLAGLVADHESCGAGGFYCETTGASRKLFLRGPLVAWDGADEAFGSPSRFGDGVDHRFVAARVA